MVALPALLGPMLAVLVAEGVGAPSQQLAVSACPEANAVWAAAAGLVGGRPLEPTARASLRVEDLGARYCVSIAGRVREVADEERDCARRVQVAAVFVALTLAPPEVPQPELILAPPPPPNPRPHRVARIEAAPTLGLNVLADDDRAISGGGIIRLLVPVRATATGGGGLGVLVDVGIAFGAEEASTAGHVREHRVPFAAGVRSTWHPSQRLEASFDVEAVATWLQVAPAGGASKGTLDWGGRLGGILAFGGRRIMPLVGGYIEASPAPPALALEPDGIVGHASSLRVGAFVGLGARIP